MHLGNRTTANESEPVFLKRDTEPVLIIGRDNAVATLTRLALNDVESGRGFAYFGDSTKLLPYISRERIKDTILFTLDWDFPRSFNPFSNVLEKERSEVAEYIVEAFSAAYPAAGTTPLLDNNLLAASLAMLSTNGTLYAARHLFTSDEYRKKVIGQLKDPDLMDAWAAFDALDARERRQQAQSVLNRLLPLTTDPWYRTIIAQQNSFTLKDTDILIVDLPKSRKGMLLAALIMARLKGRVYVERPQVFVGKGQPVFAVRYLDQVPEKLLTELLGTATLLAYRIGVKDVKLLEPEFNLHDQDFQLTELPPGSLYARLEETVLLDMPKTAFPVQHKSRVAVENRSRTPAYASKRAHIEGKIADFVSNLH